MFVINIIYVNIDNYIHPLIYLDVIPRVFSGYRTTSFHHMERSFAVCLA